MIYEIFAYIFNIFYQLANIQNLLKQKKFIENNFPNIDSESKRDLSLQRKIKFLI